jgi:hypothetical protein
MNCSARWHKKRLSLCERIDVMLSFLRMAIEMRTEFTDGSM